MSQKAYTEQKKVRILRKENGLNFKLKHRKAQKSILPGGFGGPYGRTGDQCRIRETYRWSATCHALTFCFLSRLSPTERPMFQIEVIAPDSESV